MAISRHFLAGGDKIYRQNIDFNILHPFLKIPLLNFYILFLDLSLDKIMVAKVSE